MRSDIPAVTHVDYSARVQTVHAETNPRYHRLLSAFKRRTGCAVLVNTSFNVRGEPIVCTPEDAFRCFMGTEMETLVIGNCVLSKSAQDQALAIEVRSAARLRLGQTTGSHLGLVRHSCHAPLMSSGASEASGQANKKSAKCPNWFATMLAAFVGSRWAQEHDGKREFRAQPTFSRQFNSRKLLSPAFVIDRIV